MIYLASKSPRRKEILAEAGLEFEVVTADVYENCEDGLSPDMLVKELARRKLYGTMEVMNLKNGDIVISADTVVCYGDTVMGKPKDDGDAFEMLSMLSGTYHEVYTGYAVWRNGEVICDYDVTRVKMREISPCEIREYIASGECCDKAGAYAIQGLGGIFVERIEGSYHNVVGLPICKVYSAIRELSMKG